MLRQGSFSLVSIEGSCRCGSSQSTSLLSISMTILAAHVPTPPARAQVQMLSQTTAFVGFALIRPANARTCQQASKYYALPRPKIPFINPLLHLLIVFDIFLLC